MCDRFAAERRKAISDTARTFEFTEEEVKNLVITMEERRKCCMDVRLLAMTLFCLVNGVFRSLSAIMLDYADELFTRALFSHYCSWIAKDAIVSIQTKYLKLMRIELNM